MAETVLEVQNINKFYEKDKPTEVRALQEVSLKVEKGDFTAIVGPSGSGKSTLMHILGALDKPTFGSVYLDGEDLSNKKLSSLFKIRGRKLGFVFQGYNLISTFTALENVMLAVEYSGKKINAKNAAVDALTMVGLGERLNHKPTQLSGGEKQRVAIARALVNKPAIVLADEPTGELDTKNSQDVIDLLIDLNRKEGQTFVIVTHNPEIAKQCKKIIELRDGKIVPKN